MNKRSGFTLVEILISLAVLGILLSFVVRTLSVNASYTSNTVVRSNLIDDIRVAGQMIADQVGKAIYVFAPGTSITLNSTGAGYSVQDSGGSNTWNVADIADPLIAFVEPPKIRSASNLCDPATGDFTNQLTKTKDACLTFVAYYPLIRSNVVASATGAGNPGADTSVNNSKRMIYEFRLALPYGRLVGPLLANSSPYTAYEGNVQQIVNYVNSNNGASGSLVADFIRYTGGSTPDLGFKVVPQTCRLASGNLQIAGSNPNDASKTFCVSTVNSADLNQFLSSMTVATLYITGERALNNGQVVTTPEFSFPLIPRNLPDKTGGQSVDVSL